MPNLPPRRMKGTGRVAFLAHRAEIAAEIEAGWPVKASYEARADKVGISYQQFVRYVDTLIRGGAKRPRASLARPALPDASAAPSPEPPPAPSPSGSALPPKPVPATPEGSDPNARHQPAGPGRRPFAYSPVTGKADIDRLVGPEKGDDAKE